MPAVACSSAISSSANALHRSAFLQTRQPRHSNPHSASRIANLLPSRFLSLKAFGRRPRCKPHRRDGPASETLNKLYRLPVSEALPLCLQTLPICCITAIDVQGRLCCKSRQHVVRSPKTGNIRIRRVEFLNQNSLSGLDLEKVFFAPGLKIVLQHYRPQPDIDSSQ